MRAKAIAICEILPQQLAEIPLNRIRPYRQRTKANVSKMHEPDGILKIPKQEGIREQTDKALIRKTASSHQKENQARRCHDYGWYLLERRR